MILRKDDYTMATEDAEARLLVAYEALKGADAYFRKALDLVDKDDNAPAHAYAYMQATRTGAALIYLREAMGRTGIPDREL